MARKVTWHLLSNVKLLISLLLASMTVATCLTGDGKHQMDSKRVWDSTIRDFIPAEMKEATMQILDTSSEPKLYLDEMTTTHLLIDETNNSTTAEKQLILNSQSSIFYDTNKKRKILVIFVKSVCFFKIRENDELGKIEKEYLSYRDKQKANRYDLYFPITFILR